MTFERPLFLLAAILPLIWLFFEWPRANRKISAVLKALSFVAILGAIAEPVLTTSENKMAIAVLVDTSASVSNDDLARAAQIAGAVADLSASFPVLN